ncbi:hypothetical protein ACFYR1_50955 [Streptomyces canus]
MTALADRAAQPSDGTRRARRMVAVSPDVPLLQPVQSVTRGVAR